MEISALGFRASVTDAQDIGTVFLTTNHEDEIA
jgi:hypothetical protein